MYPDAALLSLDQDRSQDAVEVSPAQRAGQTEAVCAENRLAGFDHCSIHRHTVGQGSVELICKPDRRYVADLVLHGQHSGNALVNQDGRSAGENVVLAARRPFA